MPQRGVTALAALAAGLLCFAAGANDPWREVMQKDGVTVWVRTDGAGSFPAFRGAVSVAGGIYDVLAVLEDFDRYPDWLPDFEPRLLLKRSATEYRFYGRSLVPWPFRDRDAVYESRVSVDPGLREVWVRFRSLDGVLPANRNAVRMHSVRGHYQLRHVEPGRTRVEYQLVADPGGHIPGWLARLAVRRLPLNTLVALRRQVAQTRGRYADRIAGWEALRRQGCLGDAACGVDDTDGTRPMGAD